ncbi:hypothetical protein DM02DRAFT_191648 [Periconia macrospinosa]|uniref:Uncharacterized protein n=1 Tax=Periconia macrospinosa TaxID=97972 RepID=A0A2V1D8R5_9PLEO|nr:hypothetical protein DM02DRAFT_191648 [Periconia macrospinosa]
MGSWTSASANLWALNLPESSFVYPESLVGSCQATAPQLPSNQTTWRAPASSGLLPRCTCMGRSVLDAMHAATPTSPVRFADLDTAAAMPVHRVGRNTHGNPLTPSGTHQRHSRPPYPHARTQTRVTPSTTRSVHWPGDAFSLDSSQPAELAGGYMQGDPHGPGTLMPEPISDEEDQNTDTSSLERCSAEPARLELLDLDQWDESNKDTERDLVLAPRLYWSLFLREKLGKLVQKKLSHKRITCEDTSVVVSVTERSERDLIKRFDDIDIDWTEIEEQLVEWGDRFRAGKKLRVDVSFNYLELGQPASTAAGKAGKRGYRSATQHMLAERAAQLGDEEIAGQPSIWYLLSPH